MTIADIPYAHHTQITQHNRTPSLTLHPNLTNHIGTFHAGALFTLAETASGLYLESLSENNSDTLLPLLRTSSIKYKHPAQGTVYAEASVDPGDFSLFKQQLHKRGRASIIVDVTIRDEAEKICMIGTFGWYVQRQNL